MNSSITTTAPPTQLLADALTHRRANDFVLVCAGALLTILGAQISIYIPPSPVPVTGQTLAVVLAGAALGARRGAASQLLYVALGLMFPVYADGGQGFDVLFGATGGYLAGFVIAAAIVGALAERGLDRNPFLAFTAFAFGQLAIFGLGVPWLLISTGMESSHAIHSGFTIFIAGGLIKAALAGVLVPVAWRCVNRPGQHSG